MIFLFANNMLIHLNNFLLLAIKFVYNFLDKHYDAKVFGTISYWLDVGLISVPKNI